METEMTQLNETSGSVMTADELSSQVADTVLFVSILFSIYIVVGIIGNSFVIYIYYFKYQRCNFKYFVIGLAVIDLISCTTTIPGELVVQRNWFTYPTSMMWLCKIKSYFNGFTVFISAFILLLISFDRFRKVCRPLGWQMNPFKARICCFVLFIISGLLAMPVTVLWGKQTDILMYKGHNISVTRCDRADAYKDTKLPMIFSLAILIVPTIVYMIITGVFYALILKEILCGHLSLRNIKRKCSQSASLIARPTLAQTVSFSSQVSNNETSTSTTASASNVNQIEILDQNETSTNDHDKDNESEDEVKSMPQVVPTRRKSSVAKSKTLMQTAKLRLRTKTLIMFVLTVVFAITAFLYFTLLAKGLKTEEFLNQSKAKTVFYLLAMRFYFINHIINPFVYSLMDLRFRQKFIEIFKR